MANGSLTGEKAKSAIAGNDRLSRYLLACVKQGSLAHAYLLIGPDRESKIIVLQELSKTIGVNPEEMSVVAPDDKNLISIDQIRALRSWLALSAFSGKPKMAVIKDAENMKHEAQNALLKNLEEPHPNTYLFLLVGHRDQLLQTIQSRSVSLYFGKTNNKSATSQKSIIYQDILRQLSKTLDQSERMRLWLEAGLGKEDFHDWLKDCLPILSSLVASSPNKLKLAQTSRLLIKSLANPKGQNWQLVAENLILSL